MAKPLVARVNVYALGGGFELAPACDILVTAEHAVFALPEVRRGLVAGAGGVFRMSPQLPFKAALGCRSGAQKRMPWSASRPAFSGWSRVSSAVIAPRVGERCATHSAAP